MGKKGKKAKKAEQQQYVGQGTSQVKVAGSDKKLKNTVRTYTRHILVCTDSKSKQCKNGGPDVLKAFQKSIKARKLGKQIMVTAIEHIGGCSLGPNVIIYPEGVWYGRVTTDDVDEIIDNHILAGRLVQRLLRGQRQDDPCASCMIVNQSINTAQTSAGSLN